MKKILILLFSFSIFTCAVAQHYEKVSGFLGQRFSMGVGLTLAPGVYHQKLNGVLDNGEYKIRLFKIWRADAQYTIGTYGLFGLYLGDQYSSTIVEKQMNAADWYDEHAGLKAVYGAPIINDFFYGGYYKKYRRKKGAMAPVGTYIKLGAAVHNYQIDFRPVRLITRNYNASKTWETLESKFDLDHGTMSRIEILAGFGSSRAISDKIILDFGVEAGLMPRKAKKPFNYSDIGSRNANLAASLIKKRIYEVNYLKFTIGCSILLF